MGVRCYRRWHQVIAVHDPKEGSMRKLKDGEYRVTFRQEVWLFLTNRQELAPFNKKGGAILILGFIVMGVILSNLDLILSMPSK